MKILTSDGLRTVLARLSSLLSGINSKVEVVSGVSVTLDTNPTGLIENSKGCFISVDSAFMLVLFNESIVATGFMTLSTNYNCLLISDTGDIYSVMYNGSEWVAVGKYYATMIAAGLGTAGTTL